MYQRLKLIDGIRLSAMARRSRLETQVRNHKDSAISAPDAQVLADDLGELNVRASSSITPRGIEHSQIVLLSEAARRDINWARDRQALWNAAGGRRERTRGSRGSRKSRCRTNSAERSALSSCVRSRRSLRIARGRRRFLVAPAAPGGR